MEAGSAARPGTAGIGVAWRVPGTAAPAVRRVTGAILRSLGMDGEEAGRDGGPPSPVLLAGGELEEAEAALVWGGGLAGPGRGVPALRPERVLGLRGMRSADRLVAAGVRLREIPLGDPGLLAARVAGERRPGGVPIAVVSSRAGRELPFFRRLAGSREACLVELGAEGGDGLEALRQVRDAEVVIAQDLTGLVWAEAFGRPAVWVSERSDGEHDFRFRDWFSTVFEGQARPVPLGGRLETLATEARVAGYRGRAAELGEALVRGLGRGAGAGPEAGLGD